MICWAAMLNNCPTPRMTDQTKRWIAELGHSHRPPHASTMKPAPIHAATQSCPRSMKRPSVTAAKIGTSEKPVAIAPSQTIDRPSSMVR